MTADSITDCRRAAEALAVLLARSATRVVFAESCTAGLVAASLAAHPGISQFLCGSAVTYREATKQAWLGVTSEALQRETAVSATVARQMAAGVLDRTPEADCGFSVTGHLGPDAPSPQDGQVFIGFADRGDDRFAVGACELRLRAGGRLERQYEAATAVLRLAAEQLQGKS